MDFIKFINDNSTLSLIKKTEMLNDLCYHFDYQTEIEDPKGVKTPNPQTKKEFANMKITEQIKSFVSEARRKRAEEGMVIEKLDI